MTTLSSFLGLVMNRCFLPLVAFGLLICGEVQVKADILYDNGAINGTLGETFITPSSWLPMPPQLVSDSFILGSPATVSGVQHFGLWVHDHGIEPTWPDAPIAGDWAIGSTPFANDIASGTSDISSVYLGYASDGSLLCDATLSLPAAEVPAGTSYLTLQNIETVYGDPRTTVGWDINNGPSSAFDQVGENLANQYGTGSNSFQILGTSDVPEPSSLTLGHGNAGVRRGSLFWRRRSRQARNAVQGVA